MGRVRIVGRRGRGRCAYCREALAATEAIEPCSGCGVSLHPDCRAELGGCPTLGCAQAAPRARERQAEAPATGETRTQRRRRRRRERGRVTREPPGLAARIGPYSRMLARTIWYVLLLLGIGAGFLSALAHPGGAWKVLSSGKGGHSTIQGLFMILMVLVMGCAGVFFAGSWLLRLPGFWARFGQLLDDGRVTPMRFSTYTVTSGKTTTTWVRLSPEEDGEPREIEAGGFLGPWWLSRRDGQTVYVHGQRDDEPCVIEFQDGTLALLDPGSA